VSAAESAGQFSVPGKRIVKSIYCEVIFIPGLYTTEHHGEIKSNWVEAKSLKAAFTFQALAKCELYSEL